MNIGWAGREITPPQPVCLDGQFHSRISQRVNDPLAVTALAIEGSDGRGGREQAVIVSCDLVGLTGEFLSGLREQLAPRAPGLDPRKLVVGCTHTHTGPVLNERQYAPAGPGVMPPAESAVFIRDRIADCVAEAWESRRPGAVTWAYGQAVVGHNRRAMYADGSTRMYGDTATADFECIEGYEDHSLNVLFAWDDRRNLSGMILNLACPSQVTEGEHYVSADFWHEARAEIRRRHGERLFILPQCAPAGDQSPHFLVYKQAEAAMRERLKLTEREVIGRKIADAVDGLLPTAAGAAVADPVLGHLVEDLALPWRRVTDEELAYARAEIHRLRAAPKDDWEIAAAYRRSAWYESVVERHARQQDRPSHEIELHVLRLGDVALATNPFELFLDYGLRIQARSKAVQNFLVQLACGYDGYLPTARAVRAGSYGTEPASNAIGPEGGQVLVDRTVGLIDKLWAT